MKYRYQHSFKIVLHIFNSKVFLRNSWQSLLLSQSFDVAYDFIGYAINPEKGKLNIRKKRQTNTAIRFS